MEEQISTEWIEFEIVELEMRFTYCEMARHDRYRSGWQVFKRVVGMGHDERHK